jgi:arylsulfatase A-like enzyme
MVQAMNKNNPNFKKGASKNIILISLDCVRMESLSCYKKSFDGFIFKKLIKPFTPNIDRIANDGVLFNQAICQAPFTPASHASILTGTNPPTHGIRTMVGEKLSESVKTLAEILREYDYSTGAFIGSAAISKEYGLDKGFDIYDEEFDFEVKGVVAENMRLCDESTERALKWLSEVRDNKLFLFIHYFDAHGLPLRAYLDYPIKVKNKAVGIKIVRRAYVKIIRYLMFLKKYSLKYVLLGKNSNLKKHQIEQVRKIDKQIGRLLKFLHENNLIKDTLIILTSDHGESFGEHGEYGHLSYLYDSTIKIPLIIKGLNGLQGLRFNKQVRTIDIVPTVMELVGIIKLDNPKFNLIEGKSLLNIIKDDGDVPSYIETSEEISEEGKLVLKNSYVGVRTNEWKLIINRITGDKQLFNLKNDPEELNNLIDLRKNIANELELELDKMVKTNEIDQVENLTKNEEDIIMKRLKSLGYL